MNEINNQLCRLSQGEDVAYCNHYGVRVAEQRLLLCQPPKVLLAIWTNDLQTHQDRHRTTPEQMVGIQEHRAAQHIRRHQFHSCFLKNANHVTDKSTANCSECSPFPTLVMKSLTTIRKFTALHSTTTDPSY